MSNNKIEAIFELELDRIYKTAQEGPLDIGEVKRLSMLVDSYRRYEHKIIDSVGELEDMSADDLIRMYKEMINAEPVGEVQVPQEGLTGHEGGVSESEGGAVEEGWDSPTSAGPESTVDGGRI